MDGTFGRGGHARLIAHQRQVRHYIGMDRDPEALEAAAHWDAPFPFEALDGCFSQFPSLKPGVPVDVVLLDLGVSSPQLDRGERGFSFNKPGPLDMRMNPRRGPSAADLIASLQEEELANIIYRYGEERASRKIARTIVAKRQITPIRDTLALADLIESILPRRGRNHPATLTFQALRIAVNEELKELETALEWIPEVLLPGGRALLISFHSLEDRMVKNAFRDWQKKGLGQVVTKKCLSGDEEEVRQNPRSRSAKMRVFERVAS